MNNEQDQQQQEQQQESLHELLQVRHDKMNQLREWGLDPFGKKFEQKDHAADIVSRFGEKTKEELEQEAPTVSIAGRLMAKRDMGKANFAQLLDRSGQIQIYVRLDTVGEEAFKVFNISDIGDLIGVSGVVFKTKTGELSVKAKELTFLTKSLRPLPEKYHGLKDIETRYRKRYVDLIVNPEVRDTFITRSRILTSMRRYLDLSLIHI